MLPFATIAGGRTLADVDKTERSEPGRWRTWGSGQLLAPTRRRPRPVASRGQQHTAGLEGTAFQRCAWAPRDRAGIDVDGAVADFQSKTVEIERRGAERSRSTRSFVDPRDPHQLATAR